MAFRLALIGDGPQLRTLIANGTPLLASENFTLRDDLSSMTRTTLQAIIDSPDYRLAVWTDASNVIRGAILFQRVAPQLWRGVVGLVDPVVGSAQRRTVLFGIFKWAAQNMPPDISVTGQIKAGGLLDTAFTGTLPPECRIQPEGATFAIWTITFGQLAAVLP